jgi:hypothetical protein
LIHVFEKFNPQRVQEDDSLIELFNVQNVLHGHYPLRVMSFKQLWLLAQSR